MQRHVIAWFLHALIVHGFGKRAHFNSLDIVVPLRRVWLWLMLSLVHTVVCMNRVPTQAEKKAFSQAIYVISPEELGKVVKLLDDRCPTCIRKVRR